MSERPDGGMFEHTGSTLQLLRTLRGLNQSELAEASGVRPNEVSRYESGQVQPQLAQLERLLTGLEVPLVVFIYTLMVVTEVQGVLENGLPIRNLTMKDFLEVVGRWVEAPGEGRSEQDTD